MSAIANNSILTRNPEMIAGEIDGQLVMVSIESGKYLHLNKVAGRIWEILEKPDTFENLCAILIQEYDINIESCQLEVGGFLQELLEQNAISIA